MKLFYGIILVMMLFVSACAPQATEPAAEPSAPPAATPEPEAEEEAETEGTGAAVVEPVETTSNEVQVLGAGNFEPNELTISVGSSVTWVNSGDKNIVLIIFKGKTAYMNSQKFDSGEKFEHEFTEAGEYQFWQNIAFSGDGGTLTVS